MRSPHFLTSVGYGCAALIAVEFYLLPVLIGWARRMPRLRAVVVVDLAFGWTVIGWLFAIAMALRPVPNTASEPSHGGAAWQLAEGVGLAAEVPGQRSRGVRQPAAAPPLVLPASSQDPRRSG